MKVEKLFEMLNEYNEMSREMGLPGRRMLEMDCRIDGEYSCKEYCSYSAWLADCLKEYATETVSDMDEVELERIEKNECDVKYIGKFDTDEIRFRFV